MAASTPTRSHGDPKPPASLLAAEEEEEQEKVEEGVRGAGEVFHKSLRFACSSPFVRMYVLAFSRFRYHSLLILIQSES